MDTTMKTRAVRDYLTQESVPGSVEKLKNWLLEKTVTVFQLVKGSAQTYPEVHLDSIYWELGSLFTKSILYLKTHDHTWVFPVVEREGLQVTDAERVLVEYDTEGKEKSVTLTAGHGSQATKLVLLIRS